MRPSQQAGQGHAKPYIFLRPAVQPTSLVLGGPDKPGEPMEDKPDGPKMGGLDGSKACTFDKPNN